MIWVLFSWHSLNLSLIGVIRISKWYLLLVELETPLSSFMFWQGYLTPNIFVNFIFEIYAKFPSIWYIETCIWTYEREQERPLSNVKRN